MEIPRNPNMVFAVKVGLCAGEHKTFQRLRSDMRPEGHVSCRAWKTARWRAGRRTEDNPSDARDCRSCEAHGRLTCESRASVMFVRRHRERARHGTREKKKRKCCTT